jgi:hypothetical protein
LAKKKGQEGFFFQEGRSNRMYVCRGNDPEGIGKLIIQDREGRGAP